MTRPKLLSLVQTSPQPVFLLFLPIALFFLLIQLSSAAPPASPAPVKAVNQNMTPAKEASPVKKGIGNKIRSTKKNKKANKVDERATLESVRQKVEIQSTGESNWKKAKEKTVLQYSDQIRTGPKSVARVRLGDGSKVLLLQNSQAEFENLSSLQRTIKLLRGRVRAVVNRLKGENAFKIKTPVGVASVRGTDFVVEFTEENGDMMVDVASGQVGVSKLGDLASEVIVNSGERIKFGAEGAIGDPIRSGALPLNRNDVRAEVYSAKVKEAVFAQAAEELRSAEYQEGKTLIDAQGQRVRLEEYITRPAANQFKLVVLNERPNNRLDYFTYKGTFNTTLPEDLSIALKQVNGKLGSTAPDYYLTQYDLFMSNTNDSIQDQGTGGHLVNVGFDGTNYTVTDSADATNTRTIAAAALQADGTYKIYDPVADKFSVVSAADKDEALKISVLDPSTDLYRNLASGDTYWKTNFNNYSHYVNTSLRSAYAKKTTVGNTLNLDNDVNWTNPVIGSAIEFPSGKDKLHNKISLFYSNGETEVYNTYIANDKGEIADKSRFSGLSSGAAYHNELLNWNYQQNVTGTGIKDSEGIKISAGSKTLITSGLLK